MVGLVIEMDARALTLDELDAVSGGMCNPPEGYYTDTPVFRPIRDEWEWPKGPWGPTVW